MTENRLLEADPFLLNSTQCQGIGGKKVPALSFVVTAVGDGFLPALADQCRGLCRQGRPAGSTLHGEVRRIPFPPSPEDDSVGY